MQATGVKGGEMCVCCHYFWALANENTHVCNWANQVPTQIRAASVLGGKVRANELQNHGYYSSSVGWQTIVLQDSSLIESCFLCKRPYAWNFDLHDLSWMSVWDVVTLVAFCTKVEFQFALQVSCNCRHQHVGEVFLEFCIFLLALRCWEIVPRGNELCYRIRLKMRNVRRKLTYQSCRTDSCLWPNLPFSSVKVEGFGQELLSQGGRPDTLNFSDGPILPPVLVNG